MPPGPPRFDVGPALLLELDDGVGFFDAVSEGSLFNLAGGAGAGFGVDEFVGAGFCTGSALAGFCAVRAEVTGRPPRSRLRRVGFRMIPNFFAAVAGSFSRRYSEMDLAVSVSKLRSQFW